MNNSFVESENTELISIEKLNLLNDEERNKVEENIIYKINEGVMEYYKYIPFLKNFEVNNLLTNGHMSNLSEENRAELVKNIYFIKPSPSLLDYVVEMARKNKYALECVKEISKKRPDILELPQLIEIIQEEYKKAPNVDENNLEKKAKNNITYFKLTNGLIIKLDRDNLTAYRFNQENQEWQKDTGLFIEYQYGNLRGEIFEADENYPYGEPYNYGRSL